MKAVLSHTQSKSKRMKLQIPYKAAEWRSSIKGIQGAWWHKEQKLWSIPNTQENLDKVKAIIGDTLTIRSEDEVVHTPTFEMTPKVAEQLQAMMTKLLLSGKAKPTIAAYRGSICHFLNYYKDQDITKLTKSDIEGYMYELKSRHKISDSKQNTTINAIKYYLEKVLGLDRTIYNLTRPKKHKTLPDVLTQQEVYKLINTPTNIKHRAILHLLYSSGLRRGEISKLRISDINSTDMSVFVKGAKGKKDRYTVLSHTTLTVLRKYFIKHKPSYWLFEGVDGDKYSASSVQKVYRKAAETAGVSAWSTPHTLRHSFATHLLQANVNLRYIQACLGHESPETTQIYTHVANINNSIVQSPLDTFLAEHNKNHITDI